MPSQVQRTFGYALHIAQEGGKDANAKPLQGFGGAGVLEILENDMDGTYRAVYTVRFEEAVFVLHCFQKKSKHGIATSREDMALIRARLRTAEIMAQELRHANAKKDR